MTAAEVSAKITLIDAAIERVLTGGKSYTLSDGHGSQQVTDSTLGELKKLLDYYEQKLDGMTGGTCCVSTGRKCGY